MKAQDAMGLGKKQSGGSGDGHSTSANQTGGRRHRGTRSRKHNMKSARKHHKKSARKHNKKSARKPRARRGGSVVATAALPFGLLAVQKFFQTRKGRKDLKKMSKSVRKTARRIRRAI